MSVIKDNSPGKVEILRAEVYTSSRTGRGIDIKNNLISVDIFEDIYSPFVYCDITIFDVNKLAHMLPLVGEEFFSFTFKTKLGKTVNYEFYLYNQDGGAIIGNMSSAQAFMLRGVTLERAFDAAKTVSRSYKGSYAGIAGQIFDDYIKKDTGLSFQYEPSKSVARYVVPQLSPLEAIMHCKVRAVPNGNIYSPFTFFRNSNGYHFISLNSLFNKSGSTVEMDPAIHVYGNPSPDPTKANAEMEAGMPVKNDIISFESETRHNSMSKIEEGAYNSHSFSFDLTTKQFVLRKDYNLSESKNKFQLGMGGKSSFNTDAFIKSFNNTRAKVVYTPVDFSIELDGTQTNFYPDAVGEMMSYASLLSQQQVGITFYGDSNMTAGQVVACKIYQATDQNSSPKVDKHLSGNYLATRMRHNITFAQETTYEIHVTGVKGANMDTVEGLRDAQ